MNNLPRHLVVQLLNRIAAGDDSAAGVLYAHYQNQIFAYAFRKTHNEADAEEITIDTFHVAFSKPLKYDGVCEFSTWLCGIARFKILACIRRTSERCATEVLVDDDTLDSISAPAQDVLELLASSEAAEIIRACMDKLPATHREAMYLAALEEDSVSEIANKMAIPEGTVKSRLYHAREKILRCLAAVRGNNGEGRDHV